MSDSQQIEQAIAYNFPIVSLETPIKQVIMMLMGGNFCELSPITTNVTHKPNSCALVVANQQLLGIITERDLVKLAANQINLDNTSVGEVMSREVITLKKDEFKDLFAAAELLRLHEIRHLPIIDNRGYPIGLVTSETIRGALKSTDFLRLRQVKEVMNTCVITATPDASVLEVTKLMSEHGVSCVVIAKEEKIPLGILTERDIVQFQALELNLNLIKATEVMSSPLFCLQPEDSLWLAHEKMQQFRVRRLVVTEDNHLAGIITQTSLLQMLEPQEIYKVLDILQAQVSQLQAEKIKLLESRHQELEQMVTERTNELIKRAEREKLLKAISVIIQSRSNLREILNIIAFEVREFFEGRSVNIYKLQPVQKSVIVIASSTDGTEESLLGRVLHQDEIDITQESNLNILVPIKQGQEIWGFLSVSQTVESPQDNKALLEQIAREIDLAISKIHAWEKAFIAESFLKASEARWGSLVENFPNIIIMLDREGKIEFANRSEFELNSDNLIGTSIYDYVASELIEKRKLQIKKVFQGAKISYESKYVFSGKTCYFYVEIAPVRQEGEIVNALLVAYDITKRKQAEIALQEKQKQLTAITKNIPVGIYRFIYHADGRVSMPYASAGYKELFGTSPEEMINNPERALQSIHPEDGERLKEAIKLLQQKNSNLKEDYIEYRVICPSGEIKWIRDCARFERNEQGDLILDGVHIDISDRKLAQEALQTLNQELEVKISERTAALLESEEKFRNIFQQSPIGIAILNLDGQIVQVNSKLSEITDYSESELVGINLSDITHADDVNINEAYGISEKRYITKNGDIIWVNVTAKVLENLQGNPYSVLLMVKDINDRKQAELEKQQLREQLEFILTYNPAVLYTCKISEHFATTFVSDNVSVILGYEQQKFLEQSDFWLSKIHPEDVNKVYAVLPYILAQGHGNHEYRFLHADGSYRWMLDQIKVVHSADGLAGQIVGYIADISDRKQAELALEASNIQLKIANSSLARATRLKDEFLANMSHELRTPLNAILGMSEGLQEETLGPINARQKKAIETIEKSGRHLLELIDDILDLAKIESGKLDLHLESVPVRRLCESSLTIIRPQAVKKSIQLQTIITEDLGNIVVDPRRIRQLLINLLTNAVKFTDSGGRVILRVQKNQDLLILQVEDTGIGIAAENLDKLFEPFVQIDSSLTRQYGGTGLGLALVRQIAQMHQGRVYVTSSLSRGSCFTVELPLQSELENTELIETTQDAGIVIFGENFSHSTVKISTSPLILIADDNQSNIDTIADYLLNYGYRLILANNGVEALARAKASLPDLIVMDIQMPLMDGLEAIRQLRADSQLAVIPIVVLTALAYSSDREKCKQAGAWAYLSKPVSLKLLLKTIERFFKQ